MCPSPDLWTEVYSVREQRGNRSSKEGEKKMQSNAERFKAKG